MWDDEEENERTAREREELATYRVRTKACRMRDALRRLSESFRDRLKRFDSTHDTGKYVRVYMCYLFVLTLFSLFLSYSLVLSLRQFRFFLSSHRTKRPLVYVLRIIISFSFSLSPFSFLSLVCRFIIGGEMQRFSLVDKSEEKNNVDTTTLTMVRTNERTKVFRFALLINDCKSE